MQRRLASGSLVEFPRSDQATIPSETQRRFAPIIPTALDRSQESSVEDSNDLLVELATIQIRYGLGAGRSCGFCLQRDLVMALVGDQIE